MPRATAALERSLREAIDLGDRHLGTEHVLLGLLSQGDSMAAMLLAEQGVAFETLRALALEEPRDDGRSERGA